MTERNRILQRIPHEQMQREALRRRCGAWLAISRDKHYGTLRAQLELLREADALAPAQRGPKQKRDMLLRILDVLEDEGLPIRTGDRSPVVNRVAEAIDRSPAQARDLLHQLADMVEQLREVPSGDPTKQPERGD